MKALRVLGCKKSTILSLIISAITFGAQISFGEEPERRELSEIKVQALMHCGAGRSSQQEFKVEYSAHIKRINVDVFFQFGGRVSSKDRPGNPVFDNLSEVRMLKNLEKNDSWKANIFTESSEALRFVFRAVWPESDNFIAGEGWDNGGGASGWGFYEAEMPQRQARSDSKCKEGEWKTLPIKIVP